MSVIHELLESAADAKDADEAMKFSQAALNAAQALGIAEERQYNRQPKPVGVDEAGR